MLVNSTDLVSTSPKLIKQYSINFGPQHPSAHGVLRLILEMTGEVIINASPHIGLLHRGTEKLIENKTYLQGLPYLDRLDYVSMIAQEHTYSVCVEKLLNIKVPIRAQFIRTIMLEVTRILNHLMSLTTHAMDVGALTPFLWAFEEREKLMEVYEKISGARLHANYVRPGGLVQDFTIDLPATLYSFIAQFGARVDEIEDLLTNNPIWKNRLVGIGIINIQKASDWGFSGVMLRGAGCGWDLRKVTGYEIYKDIFFAIPQGVGGDCFDRYLLRIEEMRNSLFTIKECLRLIPLGSIKNEEKTTAKRKEMKTSMEGLIQHFKYVTTGSSVDVSGYYIGT